MTTGKVPERPYVTFGESDRDPAEEHHDAVEWLVRAALDRFVGTLIEELRNQHRIVMPLAAEQIMGVAYCTTLFGQLRLMGLAEVVEFLGLNSKARLHQMRKSPSIRFPKPVAELKAGPVWLADDIEKWAPTWNRKPGRPKKEKET